LIFQSLGLFVYRSPPASQLILKQRGECLASVETASPQHIFWSYRNHSYPHTFSGFSLKARTMAPTIAATGSMLQTVEQARKCADLPDGDYAVWFRAIVSDFHRGRNVADQSLIVQERWTDLGKRVKCIEPILELDDVSAMKEPTWEAIDQALATASDASNNTINMARKLIVFQKALVDIRRYKLDKQVSEEFHFESFAGKLR
jgi:hypothetical protein